jgi:hypothetical protein
MSINLCVDQSACRWIVCLWIVCRWIVCRWIVFRPIVCRSIALEPFGCVIIEVGIKALLPPPIIWSTQVSTKLEALATKTRKEQKNDWLKLEAEKYAFQALVCIGKWTYVCLHRHFYDRYLQTRQDLTRQQGDQMSWWKTCPKSM